MTTTAVLWRCCRSCAITPPVGPPRAIFDFPIGPSGVARGRALPSSLTLAPIIAPPRNQSNSLAKARGGWDGMRNA
eukprot:3557910-Pyramimonas_sp.AAC.2